MRSTSLLLRCCGFVGALSTGLTLTFVLTTPNAGATTCATFAACLLGDNTDPNISSTFASHAGVEGESLHGDGVDGITTFTSTSKVAKSGVSGVDSSSSGTYNNGVFGFSSIGTGVHGSTTSGTGLLGAVSSAKGVAIAARAPANGTAVNITEGNSSIIGGDHGTGISLNAGGTGMSVNSDQDAIDAFSNFGYGLSVTAGAEGSGVTISTQENDGLDILTGGEIGDPYALFISGGGSVPLLVSDLLSLDEGGNLVISGSLTQMGVPASAVRTQSGRSVKMYAPREADATVEDVGETTVTSGRGSVALDPTFASTLDPRRPYYVFLTAEGDNRGLYVTGKTTRGFFIRECSGGVSTLNVQYRIVAKPYDAATTTRLAAIDPSNMPYDNAAVRSHAAKLRAQDALHRSNAKAPLHTASE